jgi:mono/diheme cytochrome c family protein
MASNSPRIRKLAMFQLAFIPFVIALSIALAVQDHKRQWNVPDGAKYLTNPLQLTDSNLAAARILYRDKCSDCHGDTGKGDGPQATMHDTAPANFTDAKLMSHFTDGELFYQISEGREPMPAFKKRLTPDQRWQLILFVRSFSTPANPPQ